MRSDKQEDHRPMTLKRLASGTEIRGTAGELTRDIAARVGYAFAQWLADRIGTTPDKLTIAVGHDPRVSGEPLAAAAIRGLTCADCDVYDCGLTTTPALFTTMLREEGYAHAAIMVTGSHHAADKNGFKLLLKEGHVTEADVLDVLERAAAAVVRQRLVTPTDATAAYIEYLRAVAQDRLEDEALRPLLGLHVIVDAAGGSCGFYEELLRELGAETEGSMNLTPDPLFSAHSPNPEDPAALEILAKAVVENEADLGVSFDPDGVRTAVVDSKGRIINRDRLIALVSAIVLEDYPGATIVTDSVTSSGLNKFITEWGGIHYRYKRGYMNVIDEAIRLNEEGIDCPVAIETSGHCAFRENNFRCDGMYLTTWLICEAMDRKREGQSLETLIDELNEPVETAEIRLPVRSEDKREAAVEVISAVMAHTLEDPRWQNAPDNREGVRICFNLEDGIANAWFQLRVSVHDPVLVLNAQSEVEGGLKQILGELAEVLGDGFEEADVTPLKDWLEKR